MHYGKTCSIYEGDGSGVIELGLHADTPAPALKVSATAFDRCVTLSYLCDATAFANDGVQDRHEDSRDTLFQEQPLQNPRSNKLTSEHVER